MSAQPGRRPRQVLRAAAAAELITLAVMLANLALTRVEAVGSALGPVHGLAYVTVVGTVLLVEEAPRNARLLALLPGVGGLLAVRTLRHAERVVSQRWS